MQAMVLEAAKRPLCLQSVPDRLPNLGQIMVRVCACAVCRTDLHIVDGELPNPKMPLIPGHEIVGEIVALGKGVKTWQLGQRIGIPWLGWTCGQCNFCCSNRENLCDEALFTGYTLDGGYAEFAVADARYCFEIPPEYSSVEAAPLLCAGMIGYRTLLMAGDSHRVGIYGFGAAAHIVAQIAKYEGREIYAFTRPGDIDGQQFARDCGANWAGGSNEAPPELMDAALIFAPSGELVPQALKSLAKGGSIVCGGIHMSDIPRFPYELLWHERTIRSVANLTRHEGRAFLKRASVVPVKIKTRTFSLAAANEALDCLRCGELRGASVLDLSK